MTPDPETIAEMARALAGDEITWQRANPTVRRRLEEQARQQFAIAERHLSTGHHARSVMRYNFDRFRHGALMAEGVAVHAESLDEAAAKATKLASDDGRDTLRFRDNEACPSKCQLCHPEPEEEPATRRPTAPTQKEADEIIGAVLRDVAELPGRTSLEDQPDLLLVTAEELSLILVEHLSPLICSSTRHPTGSERFAAELEYVGAKAPWRLCDEEVGEILSADGGVVLQVDRDSLPDEDVTALAMWIILAVNTLAGLKAEMAEPPK